MLKRVIFILMARKKKEVEAEAEANRLLAEFIEIYNELHQLIHHRSDKAEQKKLKVEFGDVFYKDLEVNKRLGKFVEFVESEEAGQDGDDS